MVHEEPLLLVTDYKISSVEQILPILEMIAREGRPLVIVAEDVEGQALAAMIMNAMRGTLKIAAIKAPHYGEERRNTLDDLAMSTGATFITRESGVKLNEVEMKHLGSAKLIESSKYETTIVGGNCDVETVESRINTLKTAIEQTESLAEAEQIQDRIVRLASGVAVIRVGGSTEVEMTERKHRIEDALEAVKSAQEEGIVSGGGTALLRASTGITIQTESDTADQEYGAAIVQAACREPIRQMALNAGESPDLIVEQVISSANNHGWNFRTGELVDLVEGGVVDPVKVTRTALQNAASCAGTLITTNFGIIQTGDE
jgi:chaperonin GroEL